VTSLRLIRHVGRLEFQAGRDAELYRSQRSGGRYTTRTNCRAGQDPRSADWNGYLTPGTGAVAGRPGAMTANPEVLVRYCNV
jgi:hypothetical protein